MHLLLNTQNVDHILERKWHGRSHIGRAPKYLIFAPTCFGPPGPS